MWLDPGAAPAALLQAERPVRASEGRTLTHERIVAALIARLADWAWASGEGLVLASGYQLRVRERGGVAPDVQFYRRNNLPIGQERGLERGRPDLAIEVLSPESRARDRVQRLQDYAALGVPEYWVIDPEDRTLDRLVLRDGRRSRASARSRTAPRIFTIAEALGASSVFRPDSFHGLAIDLAELFSGKRDAEA